MYKLRLLYTVLLYDFTLIDHKLTFNTNFCVKFLLCYGENSYRRQRRLYRAALLRTYGEIESQNFVKTYKVCNGDLF